MRGVRTQWIDVGSECVRELRACDGAGVRAGGCASVRVAGGRACELLSWKDHMFKNP